jgi:hypothetical protein
MRNDSNFVVRTAVYGDMGSINAQSIPRLQEETQLGHFDLILHVGKSYHIYSINIFGTIFQVTWPMIWIQIMLVLGMII